VWITYENPQFPCGEKSLAALREKPLFHISSYYNPKNYLKDIQIYIFLYIYKRKEPEYAFYL